MSKSGYYYYLNNVKKEVGITSLEAQIKDIFLKHNKNLGYRKLTAYLNKASKTNHNHKKIYQVMKSLNLKCEIRIKKNTLKPKTKSDHFPYLIKRNFKANKRYEKIYSDVTFIHLLNNKTAYFSCLIDGADNRVWGLLSKKHNKTLIIKSTKLLLKGKLKHSSMIINTDHGSNYFSNDYIKLSKSNFTMSMSNIGNCLDNRPIEYFFSILKTELINKIPFQQRTFKYVNQKIQEFIIDYNETRIQKCLNNLSPIEDSSLQLNQSSFWGSVYFSSIISSSVLYNPVVSISKIKNCIFELFMYSIIKSFVLIKLLVIIIIKLIFKIWIKTCFY